MGFGTNELRNYVFLRNLLDAFQQRVLEYCSNGENPAERFDRIKEIRDVVKGERELPFEATGTYPDCAGECCEGTTCVQCYAKSGWPMRKDPPSWQA